MKELEEADEFSNPFNFRINNVEQGKKTSIGGMLFISSLIVALLYFFYLLDEWSNGLLPKTVTSVIVIDSDYNQEYYFPNNLVSIGLYDEYGTIQDPNLYTVMFYMNKIFVGYISSLPSCTTINNNIFEADMMYCLDPEKYNQNLKINTQIDFDFYKCLPSKNSNCENIDYIKSLIKSNNLYINLTIYSEEFDVASGVFINQEDSFIDYVSISILERNYIEVNIQETSLDANEILSQQEISYELADANSQKSVELISDNSFGFDDGSGTFEEAYSEMKLVITNEIRRTTITYYKFSEVLAEFNAILSLLLLTGIIGKMISTQRHEIGVGAILVKTNYQRYQNVYDELNNWKGTFTFLTGFYFIKRKIQKETASKEEELQYKFYLKIEETIELENLLRTEIYLKNAASILFDEEQLEMVTQMQENIEDGKNEDIITKFENSSLKLYNAEHEEKNKYVEKFFQRENPSIVDNRIAQCLIRSESVEFENLSKQEDEKKTEKEQNLTDESNIQIELIDSNEEKEESIRMELGNEQL